MYDAVPEKFKFVCLVCGSESSSYLHIDHNYDGSWDNVVLMCERCNNEEKLQ